MISAQSALIVQYVSRMGWISQAPDLLTVGLREAYAAGLVIAQPTGPGVLGWIMQE